MSETFQNAANQILLTVLSAVILLGSAPRWADASPSFQIVKDPNGSQTVIRGVSGDGTKAIGDFVGPTPFAWTSDLGFYKLPASPDGANASQLSYDGTLGVGTQIQWIGSQQTFVATEWKDDFPVTLAPAPDNGTCAMLPSTAAYAISTNGAVIVGTARSGITGCNTYPAQWAQWDDGKFSFLPLLPGDDHGDAAAVSGDGFRVAGSSNNYSTGGSAVLWEYGQAVDLGQLPGVNQRGSYANVISGNGKVVAGSAVNSSQSVSCFMWTRTEGMVNIGLLPNMNYCTPYGITDDGSIIVGSSGVSSCDGCESAFIWDRTNGMRDLRTVLSQQYGLSGALSHWLSSAMGISADGNTIVGVTNDSPTRTSWIAQLNSNELVDPFPDLYDGPKLSQSVDTLTQRGRPVQGVSADGVAHVVVRAFLPAPSSSVTVRLLDEGNNPVNDDSSYGALSAISDNPLTSTASTLITKSVSSPRGNAVIFVYRGPANYVRNPEDEYAPSRNVYLEITPNGSAPIVLRVPIVRPPVILVHGTWSSPDVWDASTAIVNHPALSSYRLAFNTDIDALVTNTNPPVTLPTHDHYPFYIMGGAPHIRENVLGADYNAPHLLWQTQHALDLFRAGIGSRTHLKVAAVQGDAVGHSFGGLVSRAITRQPNFFAAETFRRGYFHKLVTLGASLLGTNQALRLMDGSSTCTRDAAAFTGAFNFYSVDLDSHRFNGIVWDQVGDGTGNIASDVIKRVHTPLKPFPDGSMPPTLPVGMIAGIHNEANSSILVDERGFVARRLCTETRSLIGDYLSEHYSNALWDDIFNGKPSDAIIPFSSATDMQAKFKVLPGVVHGPGTVGAGSFFDPHIGFNGPQLLDDASGAPGWVLYYLSLPVSSSEFVQIP